MGNGRILAGGLMGVLFGATAVLGQSDNVRLVEGSLSIGSAQGLAGGATVVVEARDATGQRLSEAVFRTSDRDTELAFEIGIPADKGVTLHGAIFVDEQTLWSLPVQSIAAGVEDLTLGALQLAQFSGLRTTTAFRCDDQVFEVGAYADGAVVDDGVTEWFLDAVGARRYQDGSNPDTSLEIGLRAATLTLDGVVFPSCAITAPSAPAGYAATGHEPGWSLSIAEGQIAVVGESDAQSSTSAIDQINLQGGSFRYSADYEITVTPEVCVDSQTRMPFPDTVVAVRDDTEFRGCGGAPEMALEGQWRVTNIDLATVEAEAGVEMIFDRFGAVSGSSGCNQYATHLAFGASGIEVGPIAATRRACLGDNGEREQQFFSALAAVVRVVANDDGSLVFSDGNGIDALRIVPAN